MGRPRTIDNQQILEAAREIFLERGAVATTADVARRVGISQASIFKRFKTKQELFLSAMVTARYRQDLLELFRSRTRDAGIRRALVELGKKLIPFFRQVLPLVLLSWSNRGEFGFPKQMINGSFPPAQAAQQIVALIEEEMKAGRLRKQNPWLVARTFVGALQNYVLLEIVTKGARVMGPLWSSEAYVRGVVDVLWTGIAPDRAAKKTSTRPTRKSGRKERAHSQSRAAAETLGELVSVGASRAHAARRSGPNPRAPTLASQASNHAAGRKPGGE